MTLAVQQHILRLQVAVDQVMRMQVLQTQKYLATVESHGRFTETAQLQPLSKRTTCIVIHDKTESGGSLEGEVKSLEKEKSNRTWEGEESAIAAMCYVQ